MHNVETLLNAVMYFSAKQFRLKGKEVPSELASLQKIKAFHCLLCKDLLRDLNRICYCHPYSQSRLFYYV